MRSKLELYMLQKIVYIDEGKMKYSFKKPATGRAAVA